MEELSQGSWLATGICVAHGGILWSSTWVYKDLHSRREIWWGGAQPWDYSAYRGFARVGALAWDSCRLGRAWEGKGDPGLSGRLACSGLPPCLCPRKPGWQVGKGIAMAAQQWHCNRRAKIRLHIGIFPLTLSFGFHCFYYYNHT